MDEQAASSPEITIEAETVDEAIAAAAANFGCHPMQIRYRTLTEPRRGFFGWGRCNARIRAWFHDAVSQQVDGALKAVRDMDGHFLVELRGRDVMLTVYAPLGKGHPIDVGKALVAIRDYDPEHLDEALVKAVVVKADGQPHQVARLLIEGERDGYFSLHIAADSLEASVTLFPPRRGGREVSLGDISIALVKHGIVTGLDMTELEVALMEHHYNAPIRVATGMLPDPGSTGRLEYFFRTDKHRINFREDEQGRVDLKALDLIESVKAGTRLARKHPPRPGRPGADVYGRPIAPPVGKEVELPSGENVYVEGDSLHAAIDGHVCVVGGHVQVSPFYHVKGDVNYAVGNIDFKGTVSVDGLVEDEFSLKATGSAFVRKSIGKCRVEVGGNLVVVGGILGRQGADIRVGGDLIALFVENSRIEVQGQLVVHELILHSDVAVGGHLVMNGSRATLIGGSAYAGGDITVRAIGGEGTTRTHVRAGIRLNHMKRLREIRVQQVEDEERLVKVEEAIKMLEARGQDAVAPADPRMAPLRSSGAQLQSRLKAHRDALRVVEAEILESSTGARIHVLDTAMAGTRIEIGNASLTLNAPVQYATFTRVGGEIKINPYSGDL